jgi:hypothetical protein
VIFFASYGALLEELNSLPRDKRDAWTDVLCAEAYFVLGDDERSRRHFEAAIVDTRALRLRNAPPKRRFP